jgi:hypothetical protein
MDEKIKSFLNEFKEVVTDCGKFCFMSRGKEFQKDAVYKMTKLKEKAVSLKEDAIKLKDENNANLTLSLENLTESMINELKMWVALKEDDPNSAWDFLVAAQRGVRNALQSHNTALDFNGEKYSNKLHLLEKLLFPPQLFSSPGFIIESAKCSICGKEYGECEHVKGKAYMGKLCYRIIEKCKFTEVSFVESPGNKLARTIQFTNGEITRDSMTWREIKKNESE